MVRIIMKAQTHSKTFCHCESLEDAIDIFEMHRGEFEDENGFIWSLEIDDEDYLG